MSTTKPHAPNPASPNEGEGPKESITQAMERIDPFLRFLAKATGKTMVPLQMLQKVLPKSSEKASADASAIRAAGGDQNQNEILLELTHRGVLHYDSEKQVVGFPSPPSGNASDSPSASSLPKPPAKLIGKGLHGSSDAVAKRRMKVLLWTLDKESRWICRLGTGSDNADVSEEKKATSTKKRKASPKKAKSTKVTHEGQAALLEASNALDETQQLTDQSITRESDENTMEGSGERAQAYRALHNLFSRKNKVASSSSNRCEISDTFTSTSCDALHKENQRISHWLPCQAAFAGSQPGRESRFGALSRETLDKIPSDVLHLFNLNMHYLTNGNIKSSTVDNFLSKNTRKLFLHQARAIESAMNGIHTVVCTSTGSGKSMCFLLPVIAKALSSINEGVHSGSSSILIFPTKALAQDQLAKINAMLKLLPPSNNLNQLRAGVIDGDTPHAQRDSIATDCQIILTNPDTLHAAILPNWKRLTYKQLLERVGTVVIDEAHVYDGTFGAHVALVLAVRLYFVH